MEMTCMAPDHHGSGAAVSFVLMWTAMMAPMMLPSLVPTLWRYERAVAGSGPPHVRARAVVLTGLVAVAYFAVWTAFGGAVYAVIAMFERLQTAQPAVAPFLPLAAGVAVLMAGALQMTRWKARQIACCVRAATSHRPETSSVAGAWGKGLGYGLACARCCGNLMVIPLLAGSMAPALMLAVTAAVTAERVAPAGGRVARAVGLVVLAVGVMLIA